MEIETAVKLNSMAIARDALLVRLISREMPTALRIGEVLQGKIQHLSPQKAVIQLSRGKLTVESQPGMQLEEQVRVRLVRQHPVQQLEILRQIPPPASKTASNQKPAVQNNSENSMDISRLNSANPGRNGIIKALFSGGQSLQPKSLYHGRVIESVQGKTTIRLAQGNLLQVEGELELPPGQRVLLRLAGKVGGTTTLIELMDSDKAGETSRPLLKQGQKFITHMFRKLNETTEFRSGQKTVLQPAGKTSGPVLIKPATVAEETLTGLPRFRQGQLLVSRIIQKPASGKILIELQGEQFKADAPRGISENDHILLRVTGAGPRPEFEILDRISNIKTKAIRLLRNQLINRTPIATDMVNLQQALNSAMSAGAATAGVAPDPDLNLLLSWFRPVLDSSKPPDSGLIKKMISDGGQHYEPKLAASAMAGQISTMRQLARQDLKALLIRLIGKLEQTPGNIETQKLYSLLGQTLTGIESAQASSLLTQLHGNGLRFEIPFALPQQPATLYLSINPDQHGQTDHGKKRGYGVLFLLDLKATGKIRVDAYLQAKVFRSTIYLEQATTLNFFKKSESLLQNRLQAMGFDSVRLDFKTTSLLKPEKREAFEDLSTGVPRTVNLLDTRG